MSYRIQAICTNPRCQVREFTAARKRATYVGSDEIERPVARLVCPECRMHGDVLQIEEVA